MDTGASLSRTRPTVPEEAATPSPTRRIWNSTALSAENPGNQETRSGLQSSKSKGDSLMARNFIRAECDECGNQQVIFSRPAHQVECLVCSNVLAAPTGGKADLRTEVVEELEVE
jgi:small subunit ribosomal protein S27e